MNAAGPPRAHSNLKGRTVLVVEDESIVSFMVEDMLAELGCRVIGHAAGVREALAMLSARRPDLAVLDVNLRGELVFPVAEKLQSESIPFLFATGYGFPGIPPQWRHCPVVQKPFRVAELARALEAAVLAQGNSAQGGSPAE